MESTHSCYSLRAAEYRQLVNKLHGTSALTERSFLEHHEGLSRVPCKTPDVYQNW
jgi:hypothetical protein